MPDSITNDIFETFVSKMIHHIPQFTVSTAILVEYSITDAQLQQVPRHNYKTFFVGSNLFVPCA